jgi:hypothetical protein
MLAQLGYCIVCQLLSWPPPASIDTEAAGLVIRLRVKLSGQCTVGVFSLDRVIVQY